MIPEEVRKQAPGLLFEQVGAFFTNTGRGPGRCRVCTGPATETLCGPCVEQRATYGDRLADLVVPLAYTKGGMTPRHQSEHHMWQYKNLIQPVAECLRDLKLMMLTATWLHGGCISRTVGWWEVVTFVPSAKRPGTTHPVVELARQVAPFELDATRVLLDLGPDFANESTRWPMPARFTVPPQFVDPIADRHVLVVDDTWVSGGKSQSAALALKAAGARAVTIICVARWLNWTYSDEHRRLITSLTAPYDARQCPVTGSTCPDPSG